MSRLTVPSRQTVKTLLFVLCVVTAVVVVPLGSASAQSQPGAPANFYGTITDGDGTPAPAGTEVFAVVNGSVEDSLVINETGQYGGPGGFDEKLTVNTGAGEEVVFTVGTPDGPQAAESPVAFASLESDPVEQNLTFPAGTFATVEAVDLELNTTSIEVDAATTPTVTATYSNETTRDVTRQATLATDSPEVVAINESTITGLAEGTANITAAIGGVEETVSLTVTAPPATNVGGGGGGGAGTETPEPFFTVTTLDPPSQTATVGDTITVGATITNTGGLAETQQITLDLADETVAEQSLQLRPDGANATVSFTGISTDDLTAGEYTYRVVTADDTSAGTLTLTAPSDGDDDGSDEDGTDGDNGDEGDGADGGDGDGAGDDTAGADGGDAGDGDSGDSDASDDSTPGFGILVAAVALLAVAGVASRRR